MGEVIQKFAHTAADNQGAVARSRKGKEEVNRLRKYTTKRW